MLCEICSNINFTSCILVNVVESTLTWSTIVNISLVKWISEVWLHHKRLALSYFSSEVYYIFHRANRHGLREMVVSVLDLLGGGCYNKRVTLEPRIKRDYLTACVTVGTITVMCFIFTCIF